MRPEDAISMQAAFGKASALSLNRALLSACNLSSMMLWAGIIDLRELAVFVAERSALLYAPFSPLVSVFEQTASAYPSSVLNPAEAVALLAKDFAAAFSGVGLTNLRLREGV